jgi:hypothetical protein
LAFVLAAACVKPQVISRPDVGGNPGPPTGKIPEVKSDTAIAPSGGNLTRKIVRYKEDPLILVADDGTKCAVSEAKYQESKIGSRVWCSWR